MSVLAWIGTAYGILMVTVGGFVLSLCAVGKRADQMMSEDEPPPTDDDPHYPIAKNVINVADYRRGRVDSHGAVVWAGENDVRTLH